MRPSFTNNITQIKRRRDYVLFFFIFNKQNTIVAAFCYARLTLVLYIKALNVPKAFSDGVVVCCNYTQMASDWGVVVFVKNRWLDGLRLTLPMFCLHVSCIHFRAQILHWLGVPIRNATTTIINFVAKRTSLISLKGTLRTISISSLCVIHTSMSNKGSHTSFWSKNILKTQ